METTSTFKLFQYQLASLLLLLTLSVKAQTLPPCGTPRGDSLATISQLHYNNNAMLGAKADSVEAAGCPSCRVLSETFVIPIHIYIYRNDAGVGGITDERAERLINLMNTTLRTTGVQIQLYLKNEITRINKTSYYEGISSQSQSTNMFQANNDSNAISIHIIRRNNDNFGGRAAFPWNSTRYNFTVITDFNDNTLIPDNRLVNIMVHELGHTLGLYHTHESGRHSFASNNGGASDCFQESVSRTRTQGVGCIGTIGLKKSEVNGDILSDTNADPELSETSVTAGCAYTGGGTDKWNEAWTPPTTNLMSYSRWNCRNTFTRFQRGLMYIYTQNYLTSFWPTRHYNQTANSFYKNADVDIYENDNYFQNARPILLNQQQYRAFHWKPGSNQLDVDWVLFRPTTNMSVTFRTRAVTGKPQPNTRITLFADNGTTQLFQNDNINGSTVFSEIITTTLTANTNYRLRIENLSTYPTNESKGHYYLDIFQTGVPILNASISGPAYPGACARGEWFVSATGGSGSYSYQWSIIENGNTIASGPGSSIAMYNDDPFTRFLTVQVKVTSGSQQKTETIGVSFAGCNSSALFVVSPNPASDQFTISPSSEYKALSAFNENEEFEVSIFKETSGELLGKKKSLKKELKVDSKAFNNGRYLINILDGKRIISKHIIIAH